MPTFVFSFGESVDVLAEKLVNEALIPSFRRLHPEKSGWDLSLVNVAATNMAEAASDGKDGAGRDIGRMFKRQEDVLKEWKVEDRDTAPSEGDDEDPATDQANDGQHKTAEGCFGDVNLHGSEDSLQFTQESHADGSWDSEDKFLGDACAICGAVMPPFAMVAHERFHNLPD